MNNNDRTVIRGSKKPFFTVDKEVVNNTEKLTRPTDISVYATLCMYADNVTRESYPSLDTIAMKSRCSVRTARRFLIDLEEAGYIEINKRVDSRGYQTSNQYVVID